LLKEKAFLFCLFIDGLFNGPAVTGTVLFNGRASNEYQRLWKEAAVT